MLFTNDINKFLLSMVSSNIRSFILLWLPWRISNWMMFKFGWVIPWRPSRNLSYLLIICVILIQDFHFLYIVMRKLRQYFGNFEYFSTLNERAHSDALLSHTYKSFCMYQINFLYMLGKVSKYVILKFEQFVLYHFSSN